MNCAWWFMAVQLLFAYGQAVYGQLPDSGPGRIPLEEAVERARRSSAEYRGAVRELAAAPGARMAMFGAWLPHFDIELGSVNDTVTDGKDSRAIRFGIQARQLLFDGGDSARALQGQDLAAALQREALKRIADDLRDRVLAASRELEAGEAALAVQREALTLAREQAVLARTEWQLGSGVELEAADAELACRRLEAELGRTQGAIDRTERSLALLLGFEDGRPLRIEAGFDVNYGGAALEPARGPLIERAVLFEAEARKRQLGVVKAALGYEEAWAVFLPRFQVEAAISFAGEHVPLQHPDWSLKLVCELALPGVSASPDLRIGGGSGGRNNSGGTVRIGFIDAPERVRAISAAKAGLDASRENLAAAEREQRVALAGMLDEQGWQVRQLAIDRAALECAARRCRLMAERVALGEIKRSDYVEAAIKLAEDRIGLVKSVAALLDAERQIERQCGLEPGGLARCVGGGQ